MVRVLIQRRKRLHNPCIFISIFSTSRFVNRHRVTYRVTTFFRSSLHQNKPTKIILNNNYLFDFFNKNLVEISFLNVCHNKLSFIYFTLKISNNLKFRYNFSLPTCSLLKNLPFQVLLNSYRLFLDYLIPLFQISFFLYMVIGIVLPQDVLNKF